MSTPDELQKHRERNEPSNLEIIGAYAPSSHLEVFWVGNTARDKLYILASSRRNANIIAMMGGHIRSLGNATHWKPLPKVEPGGALSQAIKHGQPGVIWFREKCVISRERVFREPKS